MITLSVSPGSVGKGGTATFIASASSPAAQPIVVNYVMGGTARNGMDYQINGSPNQIMIPAGQTSATATLIVITTKTRGSEKARMTLQPSTGYNLSVGPRHRKPRTSQATVVIHNR